MENEQQSNDLLQSTIDGESVSMVEESAQDKPECQNAPKEAALTVQTDTPVAINPRKTVMFVDMTKNTPPVTPKTSLAQDLARAQPKPLPPKSQPPKPQPPKPLPRTPVKGPSIDQNLLFKKGLSYLPPFESYIPPYESTLLKMFKIFFLHFFC